MFRAFIRDSIIYAIPAFIMRGISFFLVPLYTRVLSPSDYGALDMLMVFGSLANLTVALEVTQGVARFLSDEKNLDRRVLYSSSAFWFSMICHTLFLAVTLAFTPILSRLVMGMEGLDAIFQIGMVYLWLNRLFYVIQTQFRWELRSKNYAVVSLLVSLVTVSVSITLAYYLKWGLTGILYGMIAGSLVGCVYGLWHLRFSFNFRFQGEHLKEMLLFSAPLVPSGISVFVSLYIDRLMINHYLSLNEVGLYGIGFRLASIIGLLMAGFQGALTPLIYSHYREEQTPLQLSLIFRIFLACALLIFLGLSIFAREILWVMTTPVYYSASQVVIYQVPAILLSNMYIFAPGIDIAKKTHIILWINLCVATLHIFFNWLLIPRFGITGAAVASLLGYIFFFAVYMIFSQRLYYVPHNWKPMGFSVVAVVALAFLGSRVELGIVIDVTIKIVLLCCSGLLFMLTGLMKWAEIEKIITLAKQRFLRTGKMIIDAN
jgi:O-antigen/teichoic acid export membrane protein